MSKITDEIDSLTPKEILQSVEWLGGNEDKVRWLEAQWSKDGRTATLIGQMSNDKSRDPWLVKAIFELKSATVY